MSSLDTQAIPRVGQISTGITATVKEPDPNNPGQFLLVDLTNAQTVWIELRRPNQTSFKISAIVYGTPTNAQVRAIAGDVFDMPGTWQIRGQALFNDGSFYPGSWTDQPVGN